MSRGGWRTARADRSAGGLTFSARELRDLAVAWVALGVAFAVFLNRGILEIGRAHV